VATGNTNFSKLITTTLQNLPAEVFDAVSTNNALLYMLQKRGNLKIVAGGRTFTHPIYYRKNTSFKSYGKLDTIDTPLMDDISRAEYPIKVIAGSVVISLLEEAMNAGNKEKLIDLVEETVTRAKISMGEVMGDQVFDTGAAANDVDGLQHLVADSPSTQTDVGGIDASASDNTYWRNDAYTTTISAFNTSNNGLTQMNNRLNNTTFGRQGPRAIVTTKTVYSLYEIGLTSNIRYVTTELADAGFRHLAYTTMPVVFDDNCPANHMYFVDLDNLWLQVLARGNMEMTDMQPSHDQLLRVALLYLFGNLTTGSRRTNGVITAITG
jgi:hypothetical protein